MVRYAAKHHVGLRKGTARPGELIEEVLNEETVQRLLDLGAIETVILPEEPKLPEPPSGQESGGEPEAPGDQEQPDGDPKEPEAPEPEYVDSPAPEIDAMDGITSAVEEASKAKTSRKTGKNGGKTK